MYSPWPEAGTPLDQVATPMPVIDEDRMAVNIQRTQAYCDAHGKAFRPHIKTHKIVAVAEAQRDAGAVGLNCQKISEAEVFADAGFDDILITYNILGAAKLKRLRALHERVAHLSVVADSAVTVEGLAGAELWSDAGSRETAGQRIEVELPADSVTRVGLFIAAPATGPARQDFMISTRALDGDPRGDSDTIQFDRPEA